MSELNTEQIAQIERKIDNYLYDILDIEIPRNKFIYHCNLAYIDIVIDQQILFTVMEKHYLFSLNYNTYLAHKKLLEEAEFDYKFDLEVYKYAFSMLLKGMQYSLLCDNFPLVHSEKAKMFVNRNRTVSFICKNIPRRNYKFINDYTIRKALSYTMQFANGKFVEESMEDEDIALKLSKMYMNFWSENMIYQDYEPYTRMDWGGICYFFILASMRRFNKIYKNNFDIVKTDSQKMMIVLSPNGTSMLREYVPDCTEKIYQKALSDNVYRPIGRELYPKICISDSPLNRTKDGYIFANPLVVLFSNSHETRYLNYLRKADKPRYLTTKDKIKERAIPLIEEMVKFKHPDSIVISNFNVPIPNQNNQTRECDILLIDRNGFAVYIEMKHFYYPNSFSETKSLDSELKKAFDKMPKQLDAISKGWNYLKEIYHFDIELNRIEGIVASHQYTGFDVKIHPSTPIVTYTCVFESIAESENIEGIYKGCKEVDLIYPNIQFIQKKLDVNFAGIKFEVDAECLHPVIETEFIKAYRKEILDKLHTEDSIKFSSVSQLAEAYMKGIQGQK